LPKRVRSGVGTLFITPVVVNSSWHNGQREEVTSTKYMEDQINNIIPVLMEDIGSDGENESDLLLDYYLRCNTQEKVVVNKVMIYLCGWSFETLLKKCGIGIDEKGEPITVEDKTDE